MGVLDEPVLSDLLYHEVNGYSLPYRAYMWSSGAITHEPKLKGRPGGEVTGRAIDSATGHGYRGINVLSYSDPVTSHPVQLRWAGLDIDAEDNQKYTCIHNIVREALPQAMVRLSKSGLGVHVILWLHPTCYPIVSYDEAKCLARAMVAGPKATLQAAGITTCVTGLPNLWLWSEGGKQRTVQVGECVELPGCKATFPVIPSHEGGVVGIQAFNGAARNVVGMWFKDKFDTVPRRSQVNIGEFQRQTGIRVPTKSKCRPEHAGECNGWLVLAEDGSLKLFSNADDNQCILALYSL